ncbi:MAG: acyl carrier protein [Peptococcaceae bacterium]|jgi:acyl carrier protein|nr:acyl carrier protein [Peptococcaceae bacterium]MDH7525027.1 acyl carrier protein [Peptococcaceae bacterium]
MKNIKKELKTLIKDRFLAGSAAYELAYDSKLLDQQIIDSSGVLVLIMEIERMYGISIDDAELIPENFNTINALANLIDSKLGLMNKIS